MSGVVIFAYVLTMCFAMDYVDRLKATLYHSQRISHEANLNKSFFSVLENYEVNADRVSEAQYPWIARVIHSMNYNYPHMCTAICIDQRIFITAARCIYRLKVNYTTIMYRSTRLPALAFVIPSNGSKQAFDDIGFIVVERDSFNGFWAVIELFQGANRTDNAFKWFIELDLTYGSIDYKVVGYALEKGLHKQYLPDMVYNLAELKVVVDINICPKILIPKKKDTDQDFLVPCYHSCTVSEFEKGAEKCSKYHGVEGGAVLDTNSNKLVGVATWGAYFTKYELPVGFSVVNSANFFNDYVCAQRIRNDNGHLITDGYFQTLCNEL